MNPTNQPQTQQFLDLLLDYSREPDAQLRKSMEQEVWLEFGARHSVLVLDMSGFSMLAQRHGIVHYLAMVRRMQITAQPVIEDFGGKVVKFDADDCFAVFSDTTSAIRAAVALNKAYKSANLETPDLLDIQIACGIDQGDVLLVSGVDFFGNAVNRACKLGEDLAHPGEILVAREAIEADKAELGHALDPVNFNISGLEIEAYSVKYR